MITDKILHLIDIGSVIHAGRANNYIRTIVKDTSGEWLTRKTFVGGISFLFNIIAYDYKMNRTTLVFLADRKPIAKQRIRPSYKSNRMHNEAIESQKEIVEYILRDCGFQVLYQDEYEADDLIYTICQNYKEKVPNIFIHTSDSDIYCNVDKNVEIWPVKTGDKQVCLGNYERTCSNKELIPYNTITFEKMLRGDSADNISKLYTYPHHILREQFYNDYWMPRLGCTQQVLPVIEAQFPEIYEQARMVYPFYLDNINIDLELLANSDKINAWATVVGNNKFQRTASVKELESLSNSIFEMFPYIDD